MQNLQLKNIPGHELTPETLQAMSDLRRSIMSIKPEVDLNADFAWFTSICRASHKAFLFYDEQQKLVGMYVVLLQSGRSAQGRPYLLVLIEFGLFLPHCRGNPALPRSSVFLLLAILRQWRGQSLWVGSIAYPAGKLAIEMIFGDLVLWGEAGLSSTQTVLLENIVRMIAGKKWDAAKGWMVMATRPPAMSSTWWEKAKKHASYARYVRLCPNWEEGFCVPCVGQVRPLVILRRGLGNMLKRQIRR
jgi:hypothetical protein